MSTIQFGENALAEDYCQYRIILHILAKKTYDSQETTQEQMNEYICDNSWAFYMQLRSDAIAGKFSNTSISNVHQNLSTAAYTAPSVIAYLIRVIHGENIDEPQEIMTIQE